MAKVQRALSCILTLLILTVCMGGQAWADLSIDWSKQHARMNAATIGAATAAASQTCQAYHNGGADTVSRGLGSAAGYYYLGQIITDSTGAKICQACFYIHSITGTPNAEVVTAVVLKKTTGTPLTLNTTPLGSKARDLSSLSETTLECWTFDSEIELTGGLDDVYFIGLTMGTGSASAYPNMGFGITNTDGGYGYEGEFVSAGTRYSWDTGYDFYYSVSSMQ